MKVEKTIAYLREKGHRYLIDAQETSDMELLWRAETYLQLANELEERVKNFVV